MRINSRIMKNFQNYLRMLTKYFNAILVVLQFTYLWLDKLVAYAFYEFSFVIF